MREHCEVSKPLSVSALANVHSLKWASQDSNLRTKDLTLMTSLQANVFKWLDCGSPPWTRFELLRANGHSDRKIEPANEERFQKGRSGMPIIVHDGPPAFGHVSNSPSWTSSRTNRLARADCCAPC